MKRVIAEEGDQVRIVVWRNPELSGDFVVSANGTLNHPLYREIQVTGIPITSVEDRLRAFLTRYTTNPQFVIQPLVKVVVSGEVRSPNLLSVPPETTVAQAVVLAGGPTPIAKLDRVRLLRQGQEITVNLNSADSQAAALQIRSGDQIVVPARSHEDVIFNPDPPPSELLIHDHICRWNVGPRLDRDHHTWLQNLSLPVGNSGSFVDLKPDSVPSRVREVFS